MTCLLQLRQTFSAFGRHSPRSSGLCSLVNNFPVTFPNSILSSISLQTAHWESFGLFLQKTQTDNIAKNHQDTILGGILNPTSFSSSQLLLGVSVSIIFVFLELFSNHVKHYKRTGSANQTAGLRACHLCLCLELCWDSVLVSPSLGNGTFSISYTPCCCDHRLEQKQLKGRQVYVGLHFGFLTISISVVTHSQGFRKVEHANH